MISGGGTAGHVYPALAVVRWLMADSLSPASLYRSSLLAERSAISDKRYAICYVGSIGGVEEGIVAREGLPFRGVEAGGLRGLAPWTMLHSLCRMALGLLQSLRIIWGFKPEAILVTGGYVCVPVALAGWLCRAPILIYLPDIEPGLAISILSHFAVRIAVSFAESRRFFPPHKVVVTGYPVRPELLKADRLAAKRRFHLDEGMKTLLVFGGSRGARSINLAISRILPELLEACQVIHICGQKDEDWARSQWEGLSTCLQGRYRVYSYLHDGMADALAAADLVVARAGAATLGEFPALGKPSILVPYPYAGQHQDLNAEYLVSRGAAVKIADAELEEKLLPTILGLLSDDEALARMGEQARALAKPEAAQRIAAELVRMARDHHRQGSGEPSQ